MERNAAREIGRIRKALGSSALFAGATIVLVCASAFAGAMLRPLLDRWSRPAVPSAGELAVFLEHATVDVRLGRAAPLVERLRLLAGHVTEPATRERVLGLWAEAALDAGQLSDAATAEEAREALVQDAEARTGIRLRRIGLAVALGDLSRAAQLAEPLIGGGSSRTADEARLRLVMSMTEKDLRSWVASKDARVPEEARRAGMAALRILGDAREAERLLSPLEQAGQRDQSLYDALVDVYSALDRPRDVARVARALLNQTSDTRERARIVLLAANALARAGDASAALATIEPLRRSRDLEIRQAARRTRYEVLEKTGRLQAEVASLRDPAERAFVALAIERKYEDAARLYHEASRTRPDSLEIAEGLREAERLRDLAERRALYLQVLAKDPEDAATREKLLSVLASLGERDAARAWIRESLNGREAEPEALVAAAFALGRAGLGGDAVGYLEKAYAAEKDDAKRQQILFALGDLYAGAREEDRARRLYTSLATDGGSPEIRERAVARLASMLR